MFISIPTVRFDLPAAGSPIMSLQGNDSEELLRLLEFWQDLPNLLESVDAVLKCFEAQYADELSRLQKYWQDPSGHADPVQSIVPCLAVENGGWKLSYPHDTNLNLIDLNMLINGVLCVRLGSKPPGYVCKRCSIKFVRSNGDEEQNGSGCFGALENCGVEEDVPIVKISKRIVLLAHQHCEKVLGGAMANLSIDSNSFFRFGTRARNMDIIPSHYCFDQDGGGFELPDLSSVKDEAAMLENVFVTCKQLESHLSMAWQGGQVEDPPEVSAKIKEWAKDIQEDQRLELDGKSTRAEERAALYAKVGQRRRDNLDDHTKAIEYIESQKPKV